MAGRRRHRQRRQERPRSGEPAHKLAAKLFYALIGEAMGRRLNPVHFKLLDLQVVDHVRGFRERTLLPGVGRPVGFGWTSTVSRPGTPWWPFQLRRAPARTHAAGTSWPFLQVRFRPSPGLGSSRRRSQASSRRKPRHNWALGMSHRWVHHRDLPRQAQLLGGAQPRSALQFLRCVPAR